jgi:hypothetical protein
MLQLRTDQRSDLDAMPIALHDEILTGREGGKPRRQGCFPSLRISLSKGLLHNTLDHGEQILSAVTYLSDQKSRVFLSERPLN